MGDLVCRKRGRVRGDKGESIMGKIKRGELGIETLTSALRTELIQGRQMPQNSEQGPEPLRAAGLESDGLCSFPLRVLMPTHLHLTEQVKYLYL